jgi:hypothetical protein
MYVYRIEIVEMDSIAYNCFDTHGVDLSLVMLTGTLNVISDNLSNYVLCNVVR